jgi:hypothetical protein
MSVMLIVRLALLTCLQRHYGVDPTPWLVEARDRPFAERLDAPVLADMFWQKYVPGPIQPVTQADEDPGRIRFEPLFRAAYPKAGLKTVHFMGRSLTVHEKIAAPLARVEKRLAGHKEWSHFFSPLGGGFNDRVIAGTERTSAHAWGIAIDLNPDLGDYWRWQKGGWKNRVPQGIVDAFEAEGFIWGGRWFHFDTMHFEFRPEQLDGSCRDPAP